MVAAASNPNVVNELLTGKKIGDQTFKVHLDGYNQLDLITGKAPSARHEIFYLTETTLAAVRIDDYKYRFTDQPGGWLGATEKVDWPILTNLRLDPYEERGDRKQQRPDALGDHVSEALMKSNNSRRSLRNSGSSRVVS